MGFPSEVTITALRRGDSEWDYGEAVCVKCGAPIPRDAKAVRVLCSGRQIAFHVARPCNARIPDKARRRMVPCGGTRGRICIIPNVPDATPGPLQPAAG